MSLLSVPYLAVVATQCLGIFDTTIFELETLSPDRICTTLSVADTCALRKVQPLSSAWARWETQSTQH